MNQNQLKIEFSSCWILSVLEVFLVETRDLGNKFGVAMRIFLLSEILERDLNLFPLQMVTTRQRENDHKLAIVRVELQPKNIKISNVKSTYFED